MGTCNLGGPRSWCHQFIASAVPASLQLILSFRDWARMITFNFFQFDGICCSLLVFLFCFLIYSFLYLQYKSIFSVKFSLIIVCSILSYLLFPSFFVFLFILFFYFQQKSIFPSNFFYSLSVLLNFFCSFSHQFQFINFVRYYFQFSFFGSLLINLIFVHFVHDSWLLFCLAPLFIFTLNLCINYKPLIVFVS